MISKCVCYIKQGGSSKQEASHSKVSIIRPGCSRLLEFEKKECWSFNRDFFQKNPGQDF